MTAPECLFNMSIEEDIFSGQDKYILMAYLYLNRDRSGGLSRTGSATAWRKGVTERTAAHRVELDEVMVTLSKT